MECVVLHILRSDRKILDRALVSEKIIFRGHCSYAEELSAGLAVARCTD